MDGDYYKNKKTVAEYIALSKGIDGGELIKRFEEFLPKNSIVLEVGSGPGSDWKILNKNYNITGSDYSEDFLSYLTSHNPNGEFIKLDAITLHTKKTFDGIYSNKVLQHLTKEELIESITNSCKILNPKGVICYSFWKGAGTEIFKGLYVNYHTNSSLKKLFSHQFEILVLEDYAEFEKSDSLLLIAKRK